MYQFSSTYFQYIFLKSMIPCTQCNVSYVGHRVHVELFEFSDTNIDIWDVIILPLLRRIEYVLQRIFR